MNFVKFERGHKILLINLDLVTSIAPDVNDSTTFTYVGGNVTSDRLEIPFDEVVKKIEQRAGHYYRPSE